ncbi:M1 family metallopeptidase [Peribacillus kribbensis]|uniref:M1 family metallopeptidase n=1 Tax=Peribacillus kribbensis TaxID=356658 RepID=UPI00042352B3|nr:M1 family metallopeptidase [Peribacillus kribbensis]
MKNTAKRALQFTAAAALSAGMLGASAASAQSIPYTQDTGYDPANAGQLAKPAPFQALGKKGSGQDVLGPADPKYKMNVYYDSAKHIVTGHLEVAFQNNLKQDLKELYFNLWGNADTHTGNGASMDVSKLKVNGKKAVFNVDKTALHIPSVSLKKNKPATVSMDFKVTIPNQQDRFGWYKGTTSLGNWFPILSVYDKEGWNVDPYFPYGESFYSLTGDFDVTLTTDKEQVIAATGTEIGKPQKAGNLAIHRYKAQDVRDFALEMDPGYKVKKGTVNNVKINVYYTDEQAVYADSMLKAGLRSIDLFSGHFGTYPWPELDIVGMEGWFGGMEYPQLTMISIAGKRSQGWVQSVTAHEIGHQWFYGIIGDNEYDEPWLDESFATFAAALHDNTLDRLTADPNPNTAFHLSSPISTFTSYGDEGVGAYYQMIYGYGSRTLNDLRLKLGDDVFYSAMKAYFKEKKFGITTTRDFMEIMKKESGRDLGEFFREHRVFVSDQE